ncbi:hypothetical protein LshimejAT787_0200560 [Lyophyllum shimeji]|uniref:Uncharacterized protein n=1 Tax=Lyophyllum shimeji TaxID=47721 RepID=A0A9P3PEN6_LYOSH|nr:hypothetical protein LshimejAT787_0200560 [Lyophyllum shimeji]
MAETSPHSLSVWSEQLASSTARALLCRQPALESADANGLAILTIKKPGVLAPNPRGVIVPHDGLHVSSYRTPRAGDIPQPSPPALDIAPPYQTWKLNSITVHPSNGVFITVTLSCVREFTFFTREYARAGMQKLEMENMSVRTTRPPLQPLVDERKLGIPSKSGAHHAGCAFRFLRIFDVEAGLNTSSLTCSDFVGYT